MGDQLKYMNTKDEGLRHLSFKFSEIAPEIDTRRSLGMVPQGRWEIVYNRVANHLLALREGGFNTFWVRKFLNLSAYRTGGMHEMSGEMSVDLIPYSSCFFVLH